MRGVDAVPPEYPLLPAERPIRADRHRRPPAVAADRRSSGCSSPSPTSSGCSAGRSRRSRWRSSSGSQCCSSVARPGRCTASSPPTCATRRTSARTCLSRRIPYPGFPGKPGYPVDVEIDPPAPQGRWGAGFRLVLAIPALLLSSALGGGVSGGSFATYGFSGVGGARRGGRLPRLVRLPGSRAHAARACATCRVLLARLRRADVRLPAPAHGPLSVVRPVARAPGGAAGRTRCASR